MRGKSNTNFLADEPRQGWAFFEDTGQWRKTPQPWGAPKGHFPQEFGDWVAVSRPKNWRPPAGTLAGESLLGGGAQLNAAESAGAASGVKTGAGGHPQPYGWHGYYGATGGGSGGGQVFRGKVSPPYEVRGKVAPPRQEAKTTPSQKAPARITWKNDEPKPDPRMEDLHAPMRKTVEDMKTEVLKLESVNVNSGKREMGEPHASGRAVDINNINGVRVVDLQKATGPRGDEAREAAANLETWAKNKPEVTEIIGPTGWWKREKPGDMQRKVPTKAEDIKTLEEHKNHYHITTTW